MTLLEKLEAHQSKNAANLTQAESVVFEIISDLTNRGGLDNEWGNIDDEIQEEILKAWIEKTENVLFPHEYKAGAVMKVFYSKYMPEDVISAIDEYFAGSMANDCFMEFTIDDESELDSEYHAIISQFLKENGCAKNEIIMLEVD